MSMCSLEADEVPGWTGCESQQELLSSILDGNCDAYDVKDFGTGNCPRECKRDLDHSTRDLMTLFSMPSRPSARHFQGL